MLAFWSNMVNDIIIIMHSLFILLGGRCVHVDIWISIWKGVQADTDGQPNMGEMDTWTILDHFVAWDRCKWCNVVVVGNWTCIQLLRANTLQIYLQGKYLIMVSVTMREETTIHMKVNLHHLHVHVRPKICILLFLSSDQPHVRSSEILNFLGGFCRQNLTRLPASTNTYHYIIFVLYTYKSYPSQNKLEICFLFSTWVCIISETNQKHSHIILFWNSSCHVGHEKELVV